MVWKAYIAPMMWTVILPTNTIKHNTSICKEFSYVVKITCELANYERVLNEIWPERNVYNHISVKGQGKPIQCPYRCYSTFIHIL